MKPKEVMEELQADTPNVIGVCRTKEDKVNKLADRARIFPFRLYSLIKSRRKNTWLVLWTLRAKKAAIVHKDLFCIVDTDKGKMVYHKETYFNNMLSFTPHFFSRYAERMGIDLTGLELIRRFFERNPNRMYKGAVRTVGELKREEVYFTCEDGVGIGLVGDMFEIRTFITHDMLKGEQIDEFSDSERIRKLIYNI